jgi:hypothetical protein
MRRGERSCIERASPGEGIGAAEGTTPGIGASPGDGNRAAARKRVGIKKSARVRCVCWGGCGGVDFLGRSMELSTNPREMWPR